MSSAVYAGVSGGWLAALDAVDNLQINVAAFTDLDLPGGSIIITFDGGATQILINRESDMDFFALDPRCTHAGCRVNPYSTATNTIVCPCHGSQYDIAGQVVHGPAPLNLQSYATRFEGDSTLNIGVPGLVLRMDSIALESSYASSRRMRLTFPTMAGSQYHVRRTADLNAPFEIISFANTAAGAANHTTLTGNGATKSIWVDSSESAGFFVLELLVFQLA